MNSIEIAKLAGVSRSTVSRVINNYPNVPEDTKKKVMDIITKYNYVPHASARMLAGKHNKILGLVIIDTKEGHDKVYSSTYFSLFTSLIIDYAKEMGYNVLVSIVSKNGDFKNVKDIFYNKTVCAGIFIGAKNNDENLKDIINNCNYVSIIGQEPNATDEFSKCLIVNPDNFSGAYESVKYLISLGYKNIAHICGDMNQLSALQRLKGYRCALEDYKIPFRKASLIKGNFTEEAAYINCLKYFKLHKPDAIFASNDHMAIGCIHAAKECGIKVPEALSVIGFDDIEISKFITPSLSTVRIPLNQIASIVTSNLIQAVENGVPAWSNHQVPVKLIIRNSTV